MLIAELQASRCDQLVKRLCRYGKVHVLMHSKSYVKVMLEPYDKNVKTVVVSLKMMGRRGRLKLISLQTQ